MAQHDPRVKWVYNCLLFPVVVFNLLVFYFSSNLSRLKMSTSIEGTFSLKVSNLGYYIGCIGLMIVLWVEFCSSGKGMRYE